MMQIVNLICHLEQCTKQISYSRIFIMSMVFSSDEQWTIKPGASASFTGPDGESFRKVVLMLAAGVQSYPEIPKQRGAFVSVLESGKEIRGALEVDKADPHMKWMDADGLNKIWGSTGRESSLRLLHGYDLSSNALLWVCGKDHEFLAQIPLHRMIVDEFGKKVQAPRYSEIRDAGTMASAMTKCCANCFKRMDVRKICGKCHCVKYCSRECQKDHWPEHRKTCQP